MDSLPMLNRIKQHKLFTLTLLLSGLCLLSLPTTGGEFMGMLKAEPAYPFSGFSGQLLFKGEPVSNTKIVRQYELQTQSGVHEDTAMTDKEGYFTFESILIKYRTPILSSHEFLSHQGINILYQDETYHIWVGGKTERGEYTEFGGKPKNLRCELTEEPRRVKHEIAGVISTNCHWEID